MLLSKERPCYNWSEKSRTVADHTQTSQLWWLDLVNRTMSSTFHGERRSCRYCTVGERLYAHFGTKEAWTLNVGAAELLEGAVQRGLAVAVTSNFDSRLRVVLETLGVSRFVSAHFLSGELGVEKPDWRLFDSVLKKTIPTEAAPQPTQMLHVGDSVENDQEGASRFGCPALLLDPRQSQSTLVVNSLAQLLRRLEHTYHRN